VNFPALAPGMRQEVINQVNFGIVSYFHGFWCEFMRFLPRSKGYSFIGISLFVSSLVSRIRQKPLHWFS